MKELLHRRYQSQRHGCQSIKMKSISNLRSYLNFLFGLQYISKLVDSGNFTHAPCIGERNAEALW